MTQENLTINVFPPLVIDSELTEKAKALVKELQSQMPAAEDLARRVFVTLIEMEGHCSAAVDQARKDLSDKWGQLPGEVDAAVDGLYGIYEAAGGVRELRDAVEAMAVQFVTAFGDSAVQGEAEWRSEAEREVRDFPAITPER